MTPEQTSRPVPMFKGSPDMFEQSMFRTPVQGNDSVPRYGNETVKTPSRMVYKVREVSASSYQMIMMIFSLGTS